MARSSSMVSSLPSVKSGVVLRARDVQIAYPATRAGSIAIDAINVALNSHTRSASPSAKLRMDKTPTDTEMAQEQTTGQIPIPDPNTSLKGTKTVSKSGQ